MSPDPLLVGGVWKRDYSHEATYTTTPPAVIPDEHHLHGEEGLVSFLCMSEHHPALLLSDCCHLLWHCGVVHCQCGSTPPYLCSMGERHSLGYHSFMCV